MWPVISGSGYQPGAGAEDMRGILPYPRGDGYAPGHIRARRPRRAGSPAPWPDGSMGPMSVAPIEVEKHQPDEDVRAETPWVCIVWNDPINLMSYVTYVFQSYFGYPKRKAEKLMHDVHNKGRAVVSSGTREE